MFRLLRVIIRPSNELIQDCLIPSALWDPVALTICVVIVLWVHVCYYNVYGYLLTPWNRVLLEKLTGSAASQEIPRTFETRRFITVPTSARHLSLS